MMGDLNPNSPGMKELSEGIRLLLESGYRDIPGAFRHIADAIETKEAEKAFRIIFKGIRKIDKQVCSPHYILRLVANHIATHQVNETQDEGEPLMVEYQDNVIKVDFKEGKRIK